ncbi:MAG TPA: hypothetical protein VJP81_04765 [Candidatus Dormibacteraeota bacterium]|nr:hypothetical protein [Candidatus Dormibacteraeota bacterium]
MTRGLDQLDALVGEWITESKKYSEGRGHTKVAPTEGGKFVRIDSRQEDERFPQSTQLVGADESRDECTVLYFDSRGVHRVYRMTVVDGVWTMWREALGFNQRYIGRISGDGKTIAGQWEFSENGKSWGVDFDLTYTKVD